MATNVTDQQAIREYLLGNLPSEQQTLLEERLLAHDDLYQELEIVEDELVDEYLSQELSSPERERFESHFLASPEHQEKLRFAKAFRRFVAAETPARPAAVKESNRVSTGWWNFLRFRNPLVGYAMAGAVFLILIGITWVVWQNFSGGSRNPANVASVVLTPGLNRGDSNRDNRITVTRDVGTVRLQLLLPENRSSSFTATILDIEGREIATRTNVKSEMINGRLVAVCDVPADVLAPGDYRIKLEGVNENGNRESLPAYSLTVQIR